MAETLIPGYDLIITNGDAAGELLRRAVDKAEVLPWRDVLHDGPVPVTEDHEALSELRADYLADKGWGDHDALRETFRARDRGLAHHGAFETVVLWFEHDLYDQLQLIQILDWFCASPRSGNGLYLVQAEDFLTAHSPETILSLEGQRRRVGAAELALASKAWAAFRQPTPEAWAGLLDQDLSALPFLHAAVRRALQELPDAKSGLSRTEQAILAAINAGADTPRALFPAVQREEEAAFMGDWSFWERLEGLVSEPGAVLQGLAGRWEPEITQAAARDYLESRLSLTDFGLQVLAGAEDYAARARIDRWFGGTHLTNDTLWRWDDEKQRLVPPA